MALCVERRYRTVITDEHWLILNRDSGASICRASLLARDHPEFCRIAAQFAAAGANVFEMVNVWQVHHPALEAAYEQQRLAMALKAGADAVGETRQLFHTTKAPLDVVLAEGLDRAKSRVGLFGVGIYATEDALKASSYWPLHFSRRIMLELSMLTGNVFACAQGEVRQSLRAAPPGFDAVVGNVHGQRETVVYNNAQALVRYIIDYAILPGYAARLDAIYAAARPARQLNAAAVPRPSRKKQKVVPASSCSSSSSPP